MCTFSFLMEAAGKPCCRDCGKKEHHKSTPDVSEKAITPTSSGYLGKKRIRKGVINLSKVTVSVRGRA